VVSARNIELVREAIDAMNRGDLEWLVEHAAPDIEIRSRGVADEPFSTREWRGCARTSVTWQVLRQRGSHEVWGKPGEPRR
jgi:ketosteroid isomerase-like protein